MIEASGVNVRGPYKNGIKRRREIIESAAKVFGQFGYAGGSLRQIAQEVGVTPAALTRHFDSKEGLLLAVLDYWDEENDRAIPRSRQGLDRFLGMPTSVHHHTLDRGLIEMFLTVAAEASNPHHPANEHIRRRYERVIGNGVRELTRARDLGQVHPMTEEEIVAEVRGAYALMDGIQLQWLIDPSIDLIGIFKHGMGEIIGRWTGRPVDWDSVLRSSATQPV